VTPANTKLPVDGTVDVRPGGRLEFHSGRTGAVGGGDGAYGLIAVDETALTHSGPSRPPPPRPTPIPSSAPGHQDSRDGCLPH
jgi:hypothetical protein